MCLITDYFEEVVEKYPDNIAFVDKKREISFKQLKIEALKVAGAIIAGNYFKMPVMIYMPKNTECVAAFLGTAYSGNFYSPIDTTMPISRIRKIVDTFRPVVVITQEKQKEQVEKFAPKALILTYERIIEQKLPDENKIRSITNCVVDTDILYTLFTSGSTGIPKGVLINQRNVIDYVSWLKSTYDIDKDIVIANEAPFTSTCQCRIFIYQLLVVVKHSL